MSATSAEVSGLKLREPDHTSDPDAELMLAFQGGDEEAMSLAVTNMVGNVAGMICEGAKIGCGLKVMTAVDAAYRAATLALSGVGIPTSDGIVGADGRWPERLSPAQREAAVSAARIWLDRTPSGYGRAERVLAAAVTRMRSNGA